MIRRLGEVTSTIARRFLPDPFTIALLLTVVAYLLGWRLTDSSAWGMLIHWRDGFWNLLKFSMQMALILVTGHALATTPPVRRGLARLAGLVRSTTGAAVLVSLVAMAAGFVNWGLGLIVGALFAREVALAAKAKGVRLHYPLVVAAGYTGLLVWHGGLSGSAPLAVAKEGHFLESKIGVLPVTETTLSPLNLVMIVLLLLAVPLILARMAPGEEGIVEAPDFDRPGDRRVVEEEDRAAPAERINRSRLLGRGVAVAGLVVLAARFAADGFSALNLDTVNFLFLFLGILLHGTAVRYGRAVADGVRGTAGILIQFPFYAGIMGMVSGSGLVNVLAGVFVALSGAGAWAGIAPAKLLPLFSFLSAGLVNLFVPSGGGQWAVQGPIMLEAAGQLGVSAEKTLLAVAYGDEWTNMLQPFWALPLLGIAKIKARDMIGYTAALMLLVFPLYALALLLF